MKNQSITPDKLDSIKGKKLAISLQDFFHLWNTHDTRAIWILNLHTSSPAHHGLTQNLLCHAE